MKGIKKKTSWLSARARRESGKKHEAGGGEKRKRETATAVDCEIRDTLASLEG